MTLNQIKEAVKAGKTVCWKTSAYEIVNDNKNQWLIVCKINNSAIGLTWMDGKTMNGDEQDFFVKGE